MPLLATTSAIACSIEGVYLCCAIMCAGGQKKATDLVSGLQGVRVQDTDLAFRPRVTYSIWNESAQVNNKRI